MILLAIVSLMDEIILLVLNVAFKRVFFLRSNGSNGPFFVGNSSWIFTATRPGKRLHSELERSTIFNGKTHYFYGHFQ